MEFFETEYSYSTTSRKDKYHTIVNITAKSTKAIPYVIIPMELVNHEIKVQAARTTLHGGVSKTLKVLVSISRLYNQWYF